MSWSWLGYGSGEKRDNRKFEVVIYEEDYKELCAWVLRKPNIETGGDLFGLWADEYNAVIQFALGPGKKCRRTTVSFYQDVDYLAEVGSYLTKNEGVCHIGEWHSHHHLGLARPSGGDENTVWNNMPTYNLKRFVIFIANIEASQQKYNVNIGCFLFEIDSNGHQRPVIPGKFKILHGENPFSRKKELNEKRINGEEEKRGDEFDIDIQDLLLKEEKGKKSPFVTIKRAETKERNQREDEKRNQPPPKRSRGPPSPSGTTEPQPKQCRQEDSDTTDKWEESEGKPGGPTADKTKATEQKKEKGENREENESTEEKENVQVEKDKQDERKQPEEERNEEGMETNDPENQGNDKETENEEDNSKRDDDLKNLEAPASARETDELAGSAAGNSKIGDQSNSTEKGDKQGPASPAESAAEKTKKEGDKQGPAKLAAREMNTEDHSENKGRSDRPGPAGSAESVVKNTKKEGDKQGPAGSDESVAEKTKKEGDKQGPAGSDESVAKNTKKEDDKQGTAGSDESVAKNTKKEDDKQGAAGSDEAVAKNTKKEDQSKTKEMGNKQGQAKSADSAA